MVHDADRWTTLRFHLARQSLKGRPPTMCFIEYVHTNRCPCNRTLPEHPKEGFASPQLMSSRTPVPIIYQPHPHRCNDSETTPTRVRQAQQTKTENDPATNTARTTLETKKERRSRSRSRRQTVEPNDLWWLRRGWQGDASAFHHSPPGLVPAG
ncbi:uncharacterized protein BDV17DRAFT_219957 [Aspergillus undulatus]|uniref:uncharacterized protein n=1 Tax=Aspergillus undulatus TaxID=1810928 RepID=UPI003CCCB3B7